MSVGGPIGGAGTRAGDRGANLSGLRVAASHGPTHSELSCQWVRGLHDGSWHGTASPVAGVVARSWLFDRDVHGTVGAATVDSGPLALVGESRGASSGI
jgi:hypothetical protein